MIQVPQLLDSRPSHSSREKLGVAGGTRLSYFHTLWGGACCAGELNESAGQPFWSRMPLSLPPSLSPHPSVSPHTFPLLFWQQLPVLVTIQSFPVPPPIVKWNCTISESETAMTSLTCYCTKAKDWLCIVRRCVVSYAELRTCETIWSTTSFFFFWSDGKSFLWQTLMEYNAKSKYHCVSALRFSVITEKYTTNQHFPKS